MQKQNQRYLIMISGGAVIVVAWYFGYGSFRKWRFTSRFTAPIVDVELNGIKKVVSPYRITEKARFSCEYSFMRGKGKLIFHLENGEQVECEYFRHDSEIYFVPTDLINNEVLGIGRNLWPDD